MRKKIKFQGVLSIFKQNHNGVDLAAAISSTRRSSRRRLNSTPLPDKDVFMKTHSISGKRFV